MKLVARHYQTNQVLQIEVAQECYRQIQFSSDANETLPYIAPSLVDIQINGFAGVDLNKPISNSSWHQICHSLYAQGCTHFLATLITNTTSQLEILLKTLETHRLQTPYNCAGFHLEGPFLNPNLGYSGVHNPKWMTPCDMELFKKWQRLSSHQIRLVTLAPETNLEKGLTFIQEITRQKVRVAVGHSSLTGPALEQAIQAGVTGWTHLGNGLPQQIHKFENPLFHALAQSELFCSLIPDGLHLPPHVFKVLAKSLGQKLLLTTDATAAAGAPAGNYTLGEIQITRDEQNQARQTGTEKLAGSTLTPFEAVFRAAKLANGSWPQMWETYSTQPAQWLGLTPHKLEVDHEANFCLFFGEPEPRLIATVHQGECVFGKIPNN